MTQQKRKPRYCFEIYEGWSTENDGNQYHTKTVLSNSMKQVDKWLHDNYNLKNSEDMSDDTQLSYENSGTYSVSDHGNLIDAPEDCQEDNGELKEGYFYQTDYVTAYKEKLTPNDFAYIMQHKIKFGDVIDLTENQ